jgi:predicted nucleic acid-binding protein
VRVLVVPPADEADAAVRARLAVLRASTGVSDEDARIALAAAAQGTPLVTEDRALRVAAAEHVPGLAVWAWADLRPRIAALDDE